MTETEILNIIATMGENINVLVSALSKDSVKSSVMLYTWLDDWYNNYKVPYLKSSGLYQLRNCISKHIKPNIENVPLSQLKPIELQKGINAIESTRMRKYSFDTLCACLKKAYKLDMITDNVAFKLDPVKHTREKGMSLTREQEKHFLEIIRGTRHELLWQFYLVSGVRRSEALAIRWTDIDYIKERMYVDGTKTTCSARYVPLFTDVKIILSKLPHTSEYIFDIPVYSVGNAWKYLKAKYNLPYCIHSLRHTFSTRYYELGIKDKTIQKWLGHSDISTTLNIYTDVLTDFEREEKQKADSIRTLLK